MSWSHSPRRVALITGAGRRIGACMAEYLHEHGWFVVIHCNQSRHEADALCHRLNQRRAESVRVLSADLTQKASNQALIKQVIDWAGQLDLLVNNASIFLPSVLGDGDCDRLSQLFAINVQAPYWLSLAARQELAKQQGAIINITDIHAESPLKGHAEYCQTKAALLMQTKALAREFAPDIRVNALAPGAISWPEHENQLSPLQQKAIIDKTLLKRHGEPVFIAQALLALFNNPFITGQSLRVDGGR